MGDLEALRKLLAGLFPDLLGIELVEVANDRVVARMAVRPELCTVGGALHGGAIMAFADTLGAIGTFVNLPRGARTTTIDSSTKFVGAAASGSVVSGESTAFHLGRTTMVWQTLVRDADERLCAIVTQTQLVLPAS